MFPWLEQLAFQLLMMLYSFLGVTPVPVEVNPDWRVVENWVELPDSTYRLTIESNTFARGCKDNPNGYAVFPGVNLSKNSVYIDGRLHETNSPLKTWHLSQVFYKPVIHFEYIKNSTNVKQEVVAFIKYVGAITEYPSLQTPSFGFYFVNSDLFYVSALIILLFTFINALLVTFSGNFNKFKYSSTGKGLKFVKSRVIEWDGEIRVDGKSYDTEMIFKFRR